MRPDNKDCPTTRTKSFNICPIFGLCSEITSLVCSKHCSITYDSQGKVINFKDVLKFYPLHWRAFLLTNDMINKGMEAKMTELREKIEKGMCFSLRIS